MDRTKSQLNLLLIFLLILMMSFLLIEYLVILDPELLTRFGKSTFNIIQTKILTNHIIWKTLYILFVFMLLSLSRKKKAKTNGTGIVVFSLLTMLSFGYLFWIRDLITLFPKTFHLAVYPGAFVLGSVGLIVLIPDLMNSIGINVKNIRKSEKLGLSTYKSGNYDIELKTVEGPLILNAPFRHTWAIGSAGSGKSVSIIDPMIFQMMLSGFTGVVYDFKGTPLTETVFKAHAYLKKHTPRNYSGKIPNIKMISFTNLDQSIRLNLISPKVINSSLAAKNAATTFALALEREWIRKRDFWANSAIGLIHATIWNFAKNHKEHCTLPHVISAITSETDLFTNWLKQDDEIARLARPITEALEKGADQQVQGVMATLRNAMNALTSPELFWVFSGNDVNIQLNDPEDPQWLCICNDMEKREGISPALSILLTLLNKVLNQPGKRPVLYAIDEVPTVYIHGLADYMATCRSNKNAVLLGLQTYSQLEKEYQREEAAIIKGNCSNQFWGVVDVAEAEKVAKAFGQYDRERSSTSIGDSGTSDSFNYERIDIMSPADIRTKRAGEFVGYIADGKPGLFDTKFKMLDSYYRNKIPSNIPIPSLYEDKEYLNGLIEANYQNIFQETNELLRSV
ncbi:MAG: type IV secretion system DNA-binding domain-containing protein [Cyclobacteriaceae bacterium]|jgi:hypothetical protein